MLDNIHPVTISSRACREVLNIMKTKGIPADYGLRIGIKGGGCGGMAPMIGFDRRKDTDLCWETEGVTIYVDKKHTMYLIGKQVDFVDEAEGRGFTFVDETDQGN